MCEDRYDRVVLGEALEVDSLDLLCGEGDTCELVLGDICVVLGCAPIVVALVVDAGREGEHRERKRGI